MKILLFILAFAILAASLGRIYRGAPSDFPLHYEFAKRFASGQFLYEEGLHIPYPPLWGMFWVPWTLLPLRAAHLAAFLLVGMGGLIVTSVILARIGRTFIPQPKDRHPIALTIALALCSRFLLRDLNDAGPNIFLWAVVWVGIFLSLDGRRIAAGALVGAAAALKMTPALFIPYFLLKREWITAGVALATGAFLTALPALFQPLPVFRQDMGVWGTNVWHGVTALDPSATVLDRPTAANLSLRLALARLVQRYPAGHPLYLHHPGFIQFLGLAPRQAGWVVRAAMAAFLLAVGWRFRRPASDQKHPMILPIELATVSALSLLYSPITWNQHAVSLLPALFLLAYCCLRWDRVSGWMWGAALYYLASAVLLSRDVTGRHFALLLESYHVVTWAIVLVVALLLAWQGRLLAGAPPESEGRDPIEGSGHPL